MTRRPNNQESPTSLGRVPTSATEAAILASTSTTSSGISLTERGWSNMVYRAMRSINRRFGPHRDFEQAYRNWQQLYGSPREEYTLTLEVKHPGWTTISFPGGGSAEVADTWQMKGLVELCKQSKQNEER